MLYICVPAHNEAPTIGLLLWRIRSVFQRYSREYEIVVYDDGSTDSTGEILGDYLEVLPLTVLGGKRRVGYARALEACCREVNGRTRYPRRDGLLVMQADFTDAPEDIPEMIRRFEGGADIVSAERAGSAAMPVAERRLRRLGRWLLGTRARGLGTRDPLSGFRLYRVSVLRELLRAAGEGPLLTARGTAANVELLLRAARVGRRLEGVGSTPRYDLRQRQSRLRMSIQALAILRLARSLRATTTTAGTAG